MKYNNQIFLDEFKNKMLEKNPQKVLFVCSKDYDRYGYRKALDEINIKSVSFTSFEPCPEVSSVENGIEAYKANECDFVVAVGGGSAIDTAKGIKFYSKLDFDILAVPTTAGTGAEATRFSVLYRNKDKESVSDYSIIRISKYLIIPRLNLCLMSKRLSPHLMHFAIVSRLFGRLMQHAKAENTAKKHFPFLMIILQGILKMMTAHLSLCLSAVCLQERQLILQEPLRRTLSAISFIS